MSSEKEGVEHHIDQREPALDIDIREVTDLDRDVSAARLAAQLCNHRFGRVHAADLDTRLRQRQRNAPGPDPEFQRRPAARQPGPRPRRRIHPRPLRVQRVIHIRDGVPIRCWLQVAHPTLPRFLI